MFDDFARFLNSLPEGHKLQAPRDFLVIGPPATEAAIAAVEADLGTKFPMDFRAFLKRWNGFEVRFGPRDDCYSLRIHGTDRLAGYHRRKMGSNQAPLLVFADVAGSGGDALAFDTSGKVIDCHQDFRPDHWAAKGAVVAQGFEEFLTLFAASGGSIYWLENEA